MSQYTPNPPPYNADLATLTQWMNDEIQAIARCLSEADDLLRLKVQNVAREKTAPGDLVYCDGVNLNLGSGEGVYRRNAANSAWVFLG